MLLHFVSEPTITAKERRLIRSHVMKGKNVGKSHPARARLSRRNTTISSAMLNRSNETGEHPMHVLSLQRVFWNELSLTSYPCEIDAATERLVYQRLWIVTKTLYPLPFCTEVNLANYAWFQHILSDRAYFHTLLAISASFPAHFGGPRSISPSSLKHISYAYRMTNERISSHQACSDKTIAVVTMLAIYQRMHHQHEIGLVHFAGLKRMIELRSGLRKVWGENRGLAQKPWRLGLEFALQNGTVPVFGLKDVEELGMEIIPARCCGKHHDLPIDTTCMMHLDAISTLTQYLNAIPTETKLDPLDYSDTICIHLHRLLDHAPLSSISSSPLEDLVHLTLIAIMTTLMPEYGHNQARYDILATRLRSVLVAAASVHCELVLWAMFVGYATILKDSEDQKRLVTLCIEICTRLSLHSWIDVREVLSRYAWIHVLHDKAGLNLFDMLSEKDGLAPS